MAHGPAAGLALLETVDERLTGHYRLDAVRAHLLEMAGDTTAAFAHYRAAASSHDEPARTALPGDAGRAPQGGSRSRGRLDALGVAALPSADAAIRPVSRRGTSPSGGRGTP